MLADAVLVKASNTHLKAIARAYKLDDLVQTRFGLHDMIGSYCLPDFVEAILGAVYFDGGMTSVHKVMSNLGLPHPTRIGVNTGGENRSHGGDHSHVTKVEHSVSLPAGQWRIAEDIWRSAAELQHLGEVIAHLGDRARLQFVLVDPFGSLQSFADSATHLKEFLIEKCDTTSQTPLQLPLFIVMDIIYSIVELRDLISTWKEFIKLRLIQLSGRETRRQSLQRALRVVCKGCEGVRNLLIADHDNGGVTLITKGGRIVLKCQRSLHQLATLAETLLFTIRSSSEVRSIDMQRSISNVLHTRRQLHALMSSLQLRKAYNQVKIPDKRSSTQTRQYDPTQHLIPQSAPSAEVQYSRRDVRGDDTNAGNEGVAEKLRLSVGRHDTLIVFLLSARQLRGVMAKILFSPLSALRRIQVSAEELSSLVTNSQLSIPEPSTLESKSSASGFVRSAGEIGFLVGAWAQDLRLNSWKTKGNLRQALARVDGSCGFLLSMVDILRQKLKMSPQPIDSQAFQQFEKSSQGLSALARRLHSDTATTPDSRLSVFQLPLREVIVSGRHVQGAGNSWRELRNIRWWREIKGSMDCG